MKKPKGLLERIRDGESVVVAEGYLFEFERRGYLQAGGFVPEVVIEHPELVKSLHEEFVHAGSDVVLAFTYYGHREKLKLIGREDDLEKLNVHALQIARKVADETGTLMAGNICNSTVFKSGDQKAIDTTESMFKEQLEWAVRYGADFIVAETFSDYGEAKLALECVRKYATGLPVVVSFITHGKDSTTDGIPIEDACRMIEEAGADIVGLNCGRGPDTILPLLRKVREKCKGPISALPVPYRTTPEYVCFQQLIDPKTGKQDFPADLAAHLCSVTHMTQFAEEAKKLGVQYVGACCGNSPNYIRAIAEVYGKKPPASKYSPNMANHFIFGDKKKFDKYHTEGYKSDIIVGQS